MILKVILNGQPRSFDELNDGASLASVVQALALKSDRIAIEHNGDIAQRSRWSEQPVTTGDKLEIVHFVGGGLQGAAAPHLSETILRR